jgi:hypothetical protein
MRLWSLHPRYLDAKGIVALWREALLAQHVFLDKTKGYRNHPQLERFREHPQPVAAIGAYLRAVTAEAESRGYNFDSSKIIMPEARPPLITVTEGQVEYEWQHLLRKLEVRDPDRLENLRHLTAAELHPLFCLIPGEIARWEKV